jgi:hypothetical protein
MSQLLVITFDERETAGQAAERLKGVQKAHAASIADMAVVEKDEHGKVHVQPGSAVRSACSLVWSSSRSRAWPSAPSRVLPSAARSTRTWTRSWSKTSPQT